MIITATPFSTPQDCHHCQADIWPLQRAQTAARKKCSNGDRRCTKDICSVLLHRQLGVPLWHLHIDLWCLHRQLSFQCLLGICSKFAKHVRPVLVMHAHLPQMLWAILVSVPGKHLSGDLLWTAVLISSDWSGCSAPESGHLSHFCALPAFLTHQPVRSAILSSGKCLVAPSLAVHGAQQELGVTVYAGRLVFSFVAFQFHL